MDRYRLLKDVPNAHLWIECGIKVLKYHLYLFPERTKLTCRKRSDIPAVKNDPA
jgi:hypothetical protein